TVKTPITITCKGERAAKYSLILKTPAPNQARPAMKPAFFIKLPINPIRRHCTPEPRRLVWSAARRTLRSSQPDRPFYRPPGRAPISNLIGKTKQQVSFASRLTQIAFLNRRICDRRRHPVDHKKLWR